MKKIFLSLVFLPLFLMSFNVWGQQKFELRSSIDTKAGPAVCDELSDKLKLYFGKLRSYVAYYGVEDLDIDCLWESNKLTMKLTGTSKKSFTFQLKNKGKASPDAYAGKSLYVVEAIVDGGFQTIDKGFTVESKSYF